jgi:hypothetical protein
LPTILYQKDSGLRIRTTVPLFGPTYGLVSFFFAGALAAGAASSALQIIAALEARKLNELYIIFKLLLYNKESFGY